MGCCALMFRWWLLAGSCCFQGGCSSLLGATLLLFCCGSRMLSLCQNPFLCNDFFPSLLRSPHNQIVNVDFLPGLVVSGGLHRAGCLGGLQFAYICMECVWLSVLSFCSKGSD
ncbi:hypothetical protein A2U01_0051323 [Trifolium medium]|uniref:Secreted protein n=1 Tax=Trifolium medium TaxID=97028 RepID=A0A392R1X6_9FABA|nr:hypothetical protein [Trifolium medium]